MFGTEDINQKLNKLTPENWDNQVLLFNMFSKEFVPEEYYLKIGKETLKNPIFINEALKFNPNLYKHANKEILTDYKSQFLRTLYVYHTERFISFLNKEDLVNYDTNDVILNCLKEAPSNYKYLTKEQKMNQEVLKSTFKFNPKDATQKYFDKNAFSSFDESIVKSIPQEYFDNVESYQSFLVNIPKSLKYLPKKIFKEEDFLYLSCINQSNLLEDTLKGYSKNYNFLHNLMLTNKIYQSYYTEKGFNYSFEHNNELYNQNNSKFYTYKKDLSFIKILKKLPLDFFTDEFFLFLKNEGEYLAKTDSDLSSNKNAKHLIAEIFPKLPVANRQEKKFILEFLENLNPEKFLSSNTVNTITSNIEDLDLKVFLRTTFKQNNPKGEIKEKLLDYAKTYYLNKELSDKMVKKPKENTQQFKI